MADCYIFRKGGNQKGIYPIGADGRPTGDVIIPRSITSVGYHVFYKAANMTSIVIPDTVTSLSESAFADCTSLTSISFPGSIEILPRYTCAGDTQLRSVALSNGLKQIEYGAFHGCSGLQSVVIPDTVTKIGEYAFYNNTSLTSVTLPASLTEIGDYAFYGCTNLQTIIIPSGIQKLLIHDYAFAKCVKLNNTTVTKLATLAQGTIYGYVFEGNTTITEVTCTVPGSYYFKDCTNLRKVTVNSYFGDGTACGIGAFDGCTSLTNCTYLQSNIDKITKIPDYAFRNTALTALVNFPNLITIGTEAYAGTKIIDLTNMPSMLTEIGNGAFKNCTQVQMLSIVNTVTKIGSSAFAGCTRFVWAVLPKNTQFRTISDSMFNSTGLRSIKIPDNVTSIGANAFSGTQITSVSELPENITSIGSGAFSSCSLLESLDLTSTKITSIPSGFISNCPNLTELLLPDTVTTIGAGFLGCSTVTKLVLPPNVHTLVGGQFSGATGLADVTLPEHLYAIQGGAFSGVAVEELAIPPEVYDIQAGAFAGMSKLRKVNIPKYIARIYSGAFNSGTPLLADITVDDEAHYIIDGGAFTGLTNLTDKSAENIINHSDTIGSGAFSGCTSLRDITIDNLSGDYMFSNCKLTSVVCTCKRSDIIGSSCLIGIAELKTVEIQEGAKTIHDHCFYGCSSLQSLYLPASIENDPVGALENGLLFAMCTSLTDLRLGEGWKMSFSIGENSGVSLTHDCILAIFNNLADLSEQESKTLKLFSENLDKMSEEEKAIATNKNWILA